MKILKKLGLNTCGFAVLASASMLMSGISNAATFTGQTTENTAAGDITVTVQVDDIETQISIIWPDNRWVGVSFGSPPAHDEGYVIISSLEGADVYEANIGDPPPSRDPVPQLSQDLTPLSFTSDGVASTLVVTRATNTGDPQDFQFVAAEELINLQWALGVLGDPPTEQHDLNGLFTPIQLTAIPVPAALPLLASGLLAFGVFLRRQRTA